MIDPTLAAAHAQTLAELNDEFTDELNAMAPYIIAEEEEAPPLPDSAPTSAPLNSPTHRRLSAMAGAGNAYVFLVFPPDGAQVGIDFFGIQPEELSAALAKVSAATVVPA